MTPDEPFLARLRRFLEQSPGNDVERLHLAAIHSTATVGGTYDLVSDPHLGIIVEGPGDRREQLDTALCVIVRAHPGDPAPRIYPPQSREEMMTE